MKNIYKLLLTALVLFALVAMPVLAASVTVTWEWLNLDPDVTAFRYQLDGEEDDNWTVVEASVTSYEINGLESTGEYTLYLQQSYDGVHWSESAFATSYPLEYEEDAFLEEPIIADVAAAEVEAEADIEEEWQPVVEEEDPLFYTEDGEAVEIDEAEQEGLLISFNLEDEPVTDEPIADEPVADEPVAEEVVAEVEPVKPAKEPKVAKPNDFKFSVLVAPGVDYSFAPIATRLETQSVYTFSLDLGLGFDNIIKIGDKMGIGLQLNAGFNLATRKPIQEVMKNAGDLLKLETYNDSLSADAMINFAINGKSNMIIIGAGGTALFRENLPTAGNANMRLGDYDVNFGAIATLGYRQYIGKVFSIGLEAGYTCLFNKEFKLLSSVGGKLTLGFSF